MRPLMLHTGIRSASRNLTKLHTTRVFTSVFVYTSMTANNFLKNLRTPLLSIKIRELKYIIFRWLQTLHHNTKTTTTTTTELRNECTLGFLVQIAFLYTHHTRRSRYDEGRS